MELTNAKKLANHICRLIKVTDIIFPIGRTPKGNLGVRFMANSDDFDIMLDSIPLSTKDVLADDNNIELKRMLDKYWFDNNTGLALLALPTLVSVEKGEITQEEGLARLAPKKQRGRPKGSKAKVK